MAVKTFTTRYSRHTSDNVNKRTSNFIGGDYLLSPINVIDATNNHIEIEDFSLSLNGKLIYVESADLTFDSNTLTQPFYLYLSCEHNFNTPFETIESFDASTESITAYLDASNVSLVTGQIEGRAAIEFDKSNAGLTGGIRLEKIVSTSAYIGLGFKIYIPEGDSTNISKISLIEDESGSLSKYARWEKTSNIVDGWNTILTSYSSPDYTVGTPDYTIASDFYITVDSIVDVPGIRVDRLLGIMKDPNLKEYDDEIDIFVTDDGTVNAFVLGTYDSDWTFSDDVNIRDRSIASYAHFDSSGIHLPENIRLAYEASGADSTNVIITIADSTGATTDYLTSTISVLKPAFHSAGEPIKEVAPLVDDIHLVAENMRRHLYDNCPSGSGGYIDSTNTTSTLGYGCIFGDSTDTDVTTSVILSIGGEVGEITVDAPGLIDSSATPITYDVYLTDTLVSSGWELNQPHSLDASYAAYGILGTSLRLEFHIPGIIGGDYWTAKNNFTASIKNTRLIGIANRGLFSSVNSITRQHFYNTDSWLSLTNTTNIHPYLDPHPATRTDGLRFLAPTTTAGEYYKLSTNSWQAVSNGAAEDGRVVDVDGMEFYNLRSSSTTKYLDFANASLTLNGVGDGFRYGAAFAGHGNKMYAHGGDSSSTPDYSNLMRTFNFTSQVWLDGNSSATSQAHQGYTQLSSKKLYSICGMSDTTAYLNSNNEYDEVTDTWTSRQANTLSLKAPAAGATQLDTILLINGEKSDTNNTDTASEYTPNLFTKFLGFAVKFKYSNLFGTADHVGYWMSDSAPDFVSATQAEKDVSGFWSNNSGKIATVDGPYWGWYGMWANDPYPDYTDASFEERWMGAFWTDELGKLGPDDGPKWSD